MSVSPVLYVVQEVVVLSLGARPKHDVAEVQELVLFLLVFLLREHNKGTGLERVRAYRRVNPQVCKRDSREATPLRARAESRESRRPPRTPRRSCRCLTITRPGLRGGREKKKYI